MRRILVNVARVEGLPEAGRRRAKVSFDEALWSCRTNGATTSWPSDDALTAFAAVDARKAQVVELRFFGGLSVEEARRR